MLELLGRKFQRSTMERRTKTLEDRSASERHREARMNNPTAAGREPDTERAEQDGPIDAERIDEAEEEDDAFDDEEDGTEEEDDSSV